MTIPIILIIAALIVSILAIAGVAERVRTPWGILLIAVALLVERL